MRTAPIIFVSSIIALCGGCADRQRPQAIPTTGPYSYVANGVGMTTVDTKTIPPGIPANAELTFFGRRSGGFYNVSKGNLNEAGTLYLYDDTANKLVYTGAISPEKPTFKYKFDPTHEYRGYFVPAK